MPEVSVTTSPQVSIRKGSKSFYLSSLLFSRQKRLECWTLYRWCRTCDDRIDFAPSRAEARSELSNLRSETITALHGHQETLPIFSEFGKICRDHVIPEQYPLELLEGFAMDVDGFNYRNLEDVELYGYRVAGVVGLMMAYITGVSHPRALKNAVDMGIAMQLTNIARDVLEDARMDRVYLPENWLLEEGLCRLDLVPDAFHDPAKREAIYRVVLRLLDRADVLYRSGREGLRYLPFRASLAVAAASFIYAAIGTKIRMLGSVAITKRVFVNKFEKLALLCKGTVITLRMRFIKERFA